MHTLNHRSEHSKPGNDVPVNSAHGSGSEICAVTGPPVTASSEAAGGGAQAP